MTPPRRPSGDRRVPRSGAAKLRSPEDTTQTPSRLAARLARAWPAAAGAALLLALLHRLLDPRAVLVVRDLLTFHLPLRTVAAELTRRHGLPEWNPLIHGGQPLLSNPNYAWFYPPTWLALVLPAHWSMNLLVVLHAGIALAGAWRLLRRLGCDPPAAGLGAMGFAASPWFLPLAHTFNFLCATAWLPWFLAAGLEALRAQSRGEAARGAFAAAALLALQLLAGEPVAVLISALALGSLALGSPGALRRSVPRLIGIAALAALLGALQLVPTAFRLLGAARSAALTPEKAALWSTRPERLVDFVLPRLWGDALRDESGLWLGWNVHDRAYPYVIGLYAGLLLAVLAAAALLRWPVPHRGGWALAFATGVFLALGRHNPLWEPLRESVPLLGFVRYPEKFLVLSVAVVPIAGALGWQHLTGGGHPARGEERRRSRLPAALAAGVALVAAALAALLFARPDLGRAFVVAHAGYPLPPPELARVENFLRTEALVAAGVGAGVVVLLLAVRRGAGARRAWDVAALALLAADLGWYARGALPTGRADELLAPPPLARRAHDLGGRVHNLDESRDPTVQLRLGPEGQQQLRNQLEQLLPYSGGLWRIPYAMNADYDLMLSAWGSYAASLLPSATEPAPEEREWSSHLLGAWDVRLIVVPRAPGELLAELRRTRRPPQRYRGLANSRALPRYRFVRRVGRLESPAGAAAALRAIGYDLRDRDGCVGSGAPPPARFEPARLLAVEDEGQVVRLRYRAGGPAFLVAAVTFDEGWTATLEDGATAVACPTLLGQIGLRLPAGEHEVELRYRDPWVRVGASVSALSLLGCALAVRRLRPPDGPPETPRTETHRADSRRARRGAA